MSDHVLPLFGCTPELLMNYLKALGFCRLSPNRPIQPHAAVGRTNAVPRR